MTPRPLSLGAVLLTLTVAACGLRVESGARFASGVPQAQRTFVWDQEGDMASGDVRLENNPFFEERLHEAIEWQLSLRGIRRGEGDPDFLIHHHLSARDHELIADVVAPDGATHQEPYSYEEGAVVVHIVDARTGQDVWIGWGYASIEPALRGPEEMRRWVYAVVEKMFASWPILGR